MEHLAGFQPTLSRATRRGGLALQGLMLVVTCVYVGRLASDGSFGMELGGLVLLGVVALALAVPPHVLLALALLVFGTYSLSGDSPFTFAGAEVYSTDVLLAVVLLRAVLPRDRTPMPAQLDGLARLAFGFWAVVTIIAGIRGYFVGHEFVSILRLETPLIYSVGFYFGFGRVIRERAFDLDKAVRNLLVVALGFVAYMVFARLTNSPFETDETVGRLGPVVTSEGVLRRDYGFASAFIFYPILALAGAAYLLYSPRRIALAAVVASIGIVTTLITLIRGEIFGLVVGLAVIAFLRSDAVLNRPVRTRAIVAGSSALLLSGLVLWIMSPPTARAVVERSLPGLVEQTETADATAEYRRDALRISFAFVERHPTGLGFVSEDNLGRAGLDAGYIAHSTTAALLAYGGWTALAAGVLTVFGLLRASFRVPRPVPWLHPFFVGSLLLFIVYGFGASGLMGQGWVVGVAALISALRFHATGASK
jgi:hypothetical protein